VEHNKVETELNMHHFLTVFSAYGKSIKPYNKRNIFYGSHWWYLHFFVYHKREV